MDPEGEDLPNPAAEAAGIGGESVEPKGDAEASRTAGPEQSRELLIRLGDTDYTVTFTEEQWVRLQKIILPKPKPDSFTAAQITADHIRSVECVFQLLLNRMVPCIKDHDSRKLSQTEEEHHTVEPHHWPLDGYDTSSGYLPIQYVAEAVCDYIATIFGRAFAGREFGWTSPTNRISAADVLTSTVLDIIDYYNLGSVVPMLNNSREKDDQNTQTGKTGGIETASDGDKPEPTLRL